MIEEARNGAGAAHAVPLIAQAAGVQCQRKTRVDLFSGRAVFDQGEMRAPARGGETAIGVEREVASAPTLCRLENGADRRTAWRLHQVLVDQFIASFKQAPQELVLDFDAADNPLYGQQEGRG